MTTLISISTGHYPDPEENRYLMRMSAILVIMLAALICSF